jgi:aspartyl-tRNA(Asn)/glutamyl-tRNA(Gln) amidotransferase subunit B
MEEGSLRCDANISVRLKGSKVFGTKVEVKNMNSMRNVQKAIDFEIKRQIICIETGERIAQETRSFDALKGITISMRSKEGASDYRYFPEPDLPPLHVSADYIEGVKALMPELPKALFEKYTQQFGLNEYDANVLTENKDIAAYFESILKHTSNIKAAANWVMVGIKGYLNEQAIEIKDFSVQASRIADLINLIDEGKVSHSVAAQKVFPEMINEHHLSPLQIAEKLNLLQESNSDELQTWINQSIEKFPSKVAEYKAGKESLLGLFMGEVMKLSKGKADPKLTSQLLKNTLEHHA